MSSCFSNDVFSMYIYIQYIFRRINVHVARVLCRKVSRNPRREYKTGALSEFIRPMKVSPMLHFAALCCTSSAIFLRNANVSWRRIKRQAFSGFPTLISQQRESFLRVIRNLNWLMLGEICEKYAGAFEYRTWRDICAADVA